ncbi:DUF2251 domain-containing protein [Solimicrobium silvestre]|uniref:DUF2251 domain-containing protein n=1 Tax=Solimicrobium silvestre TaxID=2099400 RepID=A0A2S9GS69_9BURK|nr:DUF2251 domain-containing protein [Solimicrobium silvestre]PRC90551.1 hypothetical protein S2091_4742 [Solimicrobium silvestre]
MTKLRSIQFVTEEKFKFGNETVVEGDAPQGSFTVFFEDDGSTGYFYAVDTVLKEQIIQDALHIYSIGGDMERGKDCVAKIGWSTDSQKALLLIDDRVHAVFDFDERQGYCLTGYPAAPSNNVWSTRGHEWNDEALEKFT